MIQPQPTVGTISSGEVSGSTPDTLDGISKAMMNVIARFYRWRHRQTKYWLPYELQLHQLLASDRHVEPLRKVLSDQIATLWIADRSQDPTELAATYSYQCSQFYGVTDEFILCEVHAANAYGVICFGGGMLASIRLKPSTAVVNPTKFRLKNPTIMNVRIPSVVDPSGTSGWIADLENDGILRRFGTPGNDLVTPNVSPTHCQYIELFDHCAEAAVLLKSEPFYFLPPASTSPVNDGRIGSWLPVLDLRDFGGLAITIDDNGESVISLLIDGSMEWSESDLVKAIRRVHAELGK